MQKIEAHNTKNMHPKVKFAKNALKMQKHATSKN